MGPAVILSTYPDKDTVEKVARDLVESRACACVNMLEISSVYTWKGATENASEYLAIFKTVSEKAELLKQKIRETHPYDVPEIMELDVSSVNDSYLGWLADSVR